MDSVQDLERDPPLTLERFCCVVILFIRCWSCFCATVCVAYGYGQSNIHRCHTNSFTYSICASGARAIGLHLTE